MSMAAYAEAGGQSQPEEGLTERLAWSEVARSLGYSAVASRLEVLEISQVALRLEVEQRFSAALEEWGAGRLGPATVEIWHAVNVLEQMAPADGILVLKGVVEETKDQIAAAVAENADNWPMPDPSEAATLQMRRVNGSEEWKELGGEAA